MRTRTPHARARRAERGMTLIESMMALAVFSIGILGVMQLNVLAANQNGLARRTAAASNIARDLTENFERLPYEHSLLTPTTAYAVDSKDFVDPTKTTGLHSLSKALVGNELPLLGAAPVIVRADGSDLHGLDRRYAVAWRVAEVKDAEGRPQSKRIAILVQFDTVGSARKTLTFWTVKYNPQTVYTVQGAGGTLDNVEEL